jgi:5-methylcytosine-specific restriction endonuclease McrA
MDNKKCSKCEIEKDISNFSKSGKYYGSWCKECRKISEQERRILKGIKQKVKPVVVGDSHKQCLHCKQILELEFFGDNKRGRLGKHCYCKECYKIFHKEIRKNNPEKFRTYTKKYRDRRREHWRSLHRIHQFNRKNKIKAQSDGTVTEEFMKNLYATEICFWCKEVIPVDQRTAEHIIPLSSGGVHGISNLTMACISCNSSKFNF